MIYFRALDGRAVPSTLERGGIVMEIAEEEMHR